MPMILIDQAHWAQLEQVQARVDRTVRYVTDMERFGVEDWWEPATDKGDCEDIVLAKRKSLMDMGWPADALRIAVVIDGRGELHAVLTVDVQSQEGKPATYVLDSHFAHVEPWQVLNQYGYVWLERSKPGSTLWSRLDNGTTGETQRIAALATQVMPASPRWSDVKTTPVQLAQVQAAQAPGTPVQVRVTASVKLLLETQEVAAAAPVRALLDHGAPALFIQASTRGAQDQAVASNDDDVTVGPASAQVSRHGRHHDKDHGHSHSHGHGRRHTA